MCGSTRSTFDCAAVAAVALTVMWARQVVCDASTEAQQFCKSKGIPSVRPALALFTVRTFVSCRVCVCVWMLLTTTLTIVGVQLYPMRQETGVFPFRGDAWSLLHFDQFFVDHQAEFPDVQQAAAEVGVDGTATVVNVAAVSSPSPEQPVQHCASCEARLAALEAKSVPVASWVLVKPPCLTGCAVVAIVVWECRCLLRTLQGGSSSRGHTVHACDIEEIEEASGRLVARPGAHVGLLYGSCSNKRMHAVHDRHPT